MKKYKKNSVDKITLANPLLEPERKREKRNKKMMGIGKNFFLPKIKNKRKGIMRESEIPKEFGSSASPLTLFSPTHNSSTPIKP